MIRIGRILVPITLSPSCAWAARYAARLAPQLGSQLLFLHVSDRQPSGELEAFLAREIGGAVYRSVVLEGDPAGEIVAFAQKQSCDLILMPTHAYGRFRRFLLGSVTAKVLHDADCPVWTGIHHEDAPLSDDAIIRSIVCAVDLDPASIPVIRWAQDLAACFQALLTVVHAVPAADETSDNVGEVKLRHYLFGRAEDRFSSLCMTAGIKVEISLAGGPVAQVVREAALLQRAGLVVIGRGHTQRELGRLRTQAYSIIRTSPCPVLSV